MYNKYNASEMFCLLFPCIHHIHVAGGGALSESCEKLKILQQKKLLFFFFASEFIFKAQYNKCYNIQSDTKPTKQYSDQN